MIPKSGTGFRQKIMLQGKPGPMTVKQTRDVNESEQESVR
jgi:hypothetical protein